MIRSILRDLRRTWPQLLVTDLAARAFWALAVLPILGLLLEIFLLTADDGVLTDADIPLFFLHPTGLLALLIVGTLGVTVLFIDQGVLMVIGFGALNDLSVTWLDGVRYLAGRSAALASVARRVIVSLLILASPFIAAIGVIYLVFLREFDINYYLTDRPPEFTRAVLLAGLPAGVLAILVVRKISGWILSIPFVLFEGKTGKEALALSMKATKRHVAWITVLILGWLSGVFAVSMAATSFISLVGRLLVPRLAGNFIFLTLGLGTTLAASLLVNLAVSVVATAAFPLLIVRLYRRLAGPGRRAGIPVTPLGARPRFEIPGWKILAAGGMALLILIVAGYIFSESLDDDRLLAIIAHRGASGGAPENTMAAFELAIDERADWIELDVQEDADGRVIVIHDSDFMRVGGAPLKVWNTTEAERLEIDIGRWFGASFEGERAPTLREVLELARDRVGVVIELKYYGHDVHLEERVVEVVKETGMQESIQLMSLDLGGVMKAAAIEPGWPRGLLNTASLGDLTRLDLDFLALNSAAASTSVIDRAHRGGMKVYVWTINDPVRMAVMMSRGADGLITNEPALARRVMEFRRSLSPFATFLIWVAAESGFLHIDAEASPAEEA